MRAVLEGGAVGGEKSRTPPPPATTEAQHLLYIPWLSTYASAYAACTIVDRRPVKIAQSMTSKRTFAPVVRAIIDSPVLALAACSSK